jgi:hypothetical protein
MARIVGDRLLVNVARKPGEEQIIDLMQLFNRNPNRIIAVAGTVGADGAPNTCPVTLIYAKDERTLLLATLRAAPGRPGFPGNPGLRGSGAGHPGPRAAPQGAHGHERRHGHVGG